MDIKKIFATSKKRRGRSRYLLSVTVKVGQDKNGENGIDARIVCVRNRNHESMQIIVEAMLATIQEVFHIADAQLEAFYEKFMSKLPESMQRLLQAA